MYNSISRSRGCVVIEMHLATCHVFFSEAGILAKPNAFYNMILGKLALQFAVSREQNVKVEGFSFIQNLI